MVSSLSLSSEESEDEEEADSHFSETVRKRDVVVEEEDGISSISVKGT